MIKKDFHHANTHTYTRSYVAVCMFSAVCYLIIICFCLLFPNYSTCVFNTIFGFGFVLYFCFPFSVFCVFYCSVYCFCNIATFFLHLYKSTDHCHRVKTQFVCFMFSARQPPVGQGLLIHEVSRSHTTTHHSR
jgi:hypothetical protein